MILKASEGRADDIGALEALLTEPITAEQRTAIETEIYALQQGVRGERETAHILDRIYGHSERIAVIHDLRIADGLGGYVQFDHILLHRFLKRVAVLETKKLQRTHLKKTSMTNGLSGTQIGASLSIYPIR